MCEIGSRCGFVNNFDLSFLVKTLAEDWTHRRSDSNGKAVAAARFHPNSKRVVRLHTTPQEPLPG